ncbi:DUF748 domain-containing protein [Bdellovibrio bacteriovorus]|nr:DUF748 domain-containing protein [Bdellovibrio bacteriovorus]
MTTTAKRILQICILLLGLYSLAGFLVVPWIIKSQITKQAELRLQTTPQVGSVSFNPFTFELVIEKFVLPSKDQEKPRLAFNHFALNLTLYALVNQEILLKSVTLDKASARFVVFKNGATNWDLTPTGEPEKDTSQDSDWVLTLEQIQIRESGLDFFDFTHALALELPLGPMNLTAANISTSLGSTTSLKSLNVSVGEQGTISLSGDMQLKPVTVNVAVKARQIPLDFLTAYLSDHTHLTLQKGQADTMSRIQYKNGRVSVTGEAQIHNLALVPENQEKPVLEWNQLDLQGIDISTNPLDLKVAELGLKGLKTEVELRKDGTLNFRSFLKNSKTAPKTSAPVNYHVGKLSLTEGLVSYADLQIRPNFKALVQNLEGSVGPISPKVDEKIQIALAGQVEAYGKFKGKGFIIPGVKRPTLDLEMNFHNIEMTTFTPYSGHFAGYEIKKGKLFLDLNYKLVNNRIKGGNKVLLDQFTLGNKVESKNATAWPLKLGLALMKDRKGQIKFQLPVEGDVNSPSFSLGNLIWTAVKNMIINIVAAPFDFLASLVGGGDDMQDIRFAPGEAELKSAEKEKLMKLAQALAERPQLSLEIRGEYQAADKQALQINALEEKLQLFLVKNKDRSKAVRTVAKEYLKPEEFDAIDEQFAKDPVGRATAWEKKTAETLPVSEDELKNLALSRGKAVMTELAAAQVATERMYLLSGTAGDAGKTPQVTLLLKEK